MKSAAQRRPGRYTHAPVATSSAPNTVTCWFFRGVGTCGRAARSVQLARTCGSAQPGPPAPGPVRQPRRSLVVKPADPAAHGGRVTVQQRRDLSRW